MTKRNRLRRPLSFDEYLAELRSGRYKQIKGKLHGKGKEERCAVGVYCLLTRVRPLPAYLETEFSTLVEMNDIKQASFEEIADYLETRRDFLTQKGFL